MLLRNANSQTSSLAEVINDKKQTSELLALVTEPKKLFVTYLVWKHELSLPTGVEEVDVGSCRQNED
ncbi:hypothetical protein PI125_g24724 [Phytophthora idaei]|nr:hypothetical protein PI125_g24724 [Phytophthora idaei]